MAGIVFSQKVATWTVTDTAVLTNIADLGHIEADRAELAVIRDEVWTLGNQQIALEAQLSQVIRDLESRYKKGDAIHARMRASIRGRYGYQSEKLQEFQLQPFRRPVRSAGKAKKTEKAPALDPNSAA
jgi:hypothetical protein